MQRPRVAIAVTVEQTTGQGGTVAAPIAKQVMESLLRGRMSEIAENTVIDGRYRVLHKIGVGRDGRRLLRRGHAPRPQASRSSCCTRASRRTASSSSASGARPPRRPGLQHPNVVGVYDRGEFDGTYYIAMEYCEGGSLKDVIAREAPLDPRRAIAITKQILVAARFAHRRNVIHRDLKPHNVILDDEDNVKVTDFGIARAGASDITEVGAIMGTAQYLSPEQAQGRPVTEASDLYSIGVVLFEMLTGQGAVRRRQRGRDRAQAREPAARPRRASSCPAIPPELEAVVLKALAKDPAAALPRRGVVHARPRGRRVAPRPGPGRRREHRGVRARAGAGAGRVHSRSGGFHARAGRTVSGLRRRLLSRPRSKPR